MRVDEKLERVIAPAIRSLSGHDDEDGDVLIAGLERVKSLCDQEIAAIRGRVATRAAEMFAPPDEG